MKLWENIFIMLSLYVFIWITLIYQHHEVVMRHKWEINVKLLWKLSVLYKCCSFYICRWSCVYFRISRKYVHMPTVSNRWEDIEQLYNLLQSHCVWNLVPGFEPGVSRAVLLPTRQPCLLQSAWWFPPFQGTFYYDTEGSVLSHDNIKDLVVSFLKKLNPKSSVKSATICNFCFFTNTVRESMGRRWEEAKKARKNALYRQPLCQGNSSSCWV